MCARYLGFVLLAWLPGLIQAQKAGQPCPPLVLSGGYFVPEQQQYPDGTTVTYSCDAGLKPVVEGWWATSTCQNGKWSHTPECIDENACLAPTIPNSKYTESPNGWYEENQQISVTCKKGYQWKLRSSTISCSKSKWSPVLVCEKSSNACDEPPKIPNAVIKQRPQEVYPHNFQLHYECEDGYSSSDSKSITCFTGTWTTGPPCTSDCVIHKPTQLDLEQTSPIAIKGGAVQYIQCQWSDFRRPFMCTNRRILTSYTCCHNHNIRIGHCGSDTLRYQLSPTGSLINA